MLCTVGNGIDPYEVMLFEGVFVSELYLRLRILSLFGRSTTTTA